MVHLRDIMQTEVIGVDPDLTLRGLVEMLGDHGVSGAPVISNDRVSGVVSVTDVIEFTERTPGVPREREPAPDDTEWAGGSDEDETAPEFFSELWAPTSVDALERMRQADSPEWDVLDQHVVSEVMTRRVISLPPDASVREAAKLMMESGIHRVLVIDDGELSGIVTSSDIVRAVADGKLQGKR